MNSTTLQICNLSFKYKESKNNILDNINLTIPKGKIIALLGNNGAGKSTLISCINAINTPTTGSIEVWGKDILNQNSIDRAKLVSYVPQHSTVNTLNVYETIMLGRRPHIHISPSRQDHYMVSRIIDNLNLGSIADKPTNKLSGGEFQKVCIARAFVQNSPLILMDEPSNNLDVKNQKEIFDLLRKYVSEKDVSAFCVIHDINLAIKYADGLVFMKNGTIVKTGDKSIVTKELIEKIYDVPAHIFEENNSKFVVI